MHQESHGRLTVAPQCTIFLVRTWQSIHDAAGWEGVLAQVPVCVCATESTLLPETGYTLPMNVQLASQVAPT